jgi:hypothetical protein
MRRPLTVWLVDTIRPRRMSLTSTVTPDLGLLRGDTRRASSSDVVSDLGALFVKAFWVTGERR